MMVMMMMMMVMIISLNDDERYLTLTVISRRPLPYKLKLSPVDMRRIRKTNIETESVDVNEKIKEFLPASTTPHHQLLIRVSRSEKKAILAELSDVSETQT